MPSHNTPLTRSIRPRKLAKLKNLREFWNSLPPSKKPKGRKGKFFKENIDVILHTISKKLIDGKYKFQKLTFKSIAKSAEKDRIICIPHIHDRFVQRFILHTLTQPKDKLRVLNEISFGSVKGAKKSAHAAINQALVLRKQSPWVLKTDISSFFDKIDRNDLLSILRKKLKKSSLLPLIEQVINCEIKTSTIFDGNLLKKNGIIAGKGLRQGMPLSPYLSNVFLLSFDKALKNNKIKVIRYVDDIIAFCDSEEKCIKTKKIIEDELEIIKLEIPSLACINSKTEIKNPDESIIFLGIEIYKVKEREYSIKIPKMIFERCKEELESYSNYKELLKSGLTFPLAIRKLENKRKGYESAFKHAVNLITFLNHFDRIKNEAQKHLIDDVLGAELFASLDKDKKRFLGFSSV